LRDPPEDPKEPDELLDVVVAAVVAAESAEEVFDEPAFLVEEEALPASLTAAEPVASIESNVLVALENFFIIVNLEDFLVVVTFQDVVEEAFAKRLVFSTALPVLLLGISKSQSRWLKVGMAEALGARARAAHESLMSSS
jgi:hypothetical protein